MDYFFVSSYGRAAFVLMAIWSLVWKGLALWQAAKKNDKIWYVVLLIVKTVGILDIIYLYFISPSEKSGKKTK